MKNNMRIYCLGSSYVGGRAQQQDAYGIKQNYQDVMAVVCDGMGGLSGGQQASETAVNCFLSAFESQAVDDIPTDLFELAKDADRQVYALTDETGKPLQAGTTLAAVYIREGRMYFISVGDSRIYIYRNHQLIQVTQDHNYSYLLEKDKDLMSKETYENEKKRGEALISYLGMGGLEYVSFNPHTAVELQAGDYILICSDGLYKRLSDPDIARLVSLAPALGLDNTLKLLQSEAKNTGGAIAQDNTTIILMTYR